MNVSCFAPAKMEVPAVPNAKASPILLKYTKPENTNEITLYVSEQPAQITVMPDIQEDEIEELEFSTGFDTIFVNVGSEVNIPLYVKTVDGIYYKLVSADHLSFNAIKI